MPTDIHDAEPWGMAVRVAWPRRGGPHWPNLRSHKPAVIKADLVPNGRLQDPLATLADPGLRGYRLVTPALEVSPRRQREAWRTAQAIVQYIPSASHPPRNSKTAPTVAETPAIPTLVPLVKRR